MIRYHTMRSKLSRPGMYCTTSTRSRSGANQGTGATDWGLRIMPVFKRNMTLCRATYFYYEYLTKKRVIKNPSAHSSYQSSSSDTAPEPRQPLQPSAVTPVTATVTAAVPAAVTAISSSTIQPTGHPTNFCTACDWYFSHNRTNFQPLTLL